MQSPPTKSSILLDKRGQLVGKLDLNGIASLEADSTVLLASRSGQPQSLKAAFKAVADSRRGSSPGCVSESASDEDYDAIQVDPFTSSRTGGFIQEQIIPEGNIGLPSEKLDKPESRTRLTKLKSIPVTLNKLEESGRYVLTADDDALREVLKMGIERESNPALVKRKSKFSDLVFTRRFTAFDGRNTGNSDSIFHGFFNLFWLGIGIFMIQLFVENWQNHGSVLGGNDIVKLAFRRDILVLLLSDAVMCASTFFGLLFQNLISKGIINWNREGWIIQSAWEMLWLAGAIEWTLFREWPWTHTVFFVLQGLVMLMKQHSYAFYNGHLSEAYKMRATLQRKLKQLEDMQPVASPASTTLQISSLSTSYLDSRPTASGLHQRPQSFKRGSFDTSKSDVRRVAAAIESEEPLDADQVHTFERIIKWEIDALTEDLKGKCSKTENYYPSNLTFINHCDFTVLPTLVYELEYPRSEKIDWYYAAEKAVATLGILAIMNILSQARIYPVVMRTLEMKSMPLKERLLKFPLILNDLVFPFMMEYLMTWYVIWECVLNFLAELTKFADRGFYDDWWNSVSWDQYARQWNRPVHLFLLRHVYNSSISSLKVSKYTATLITFFLSAVLHELIMFMLFHKLRGYLLILQMSQIPLVALNRTKFMKGRATLGNLVFCTLAGYLKNAKNLLKSFPDSLLPRTTTSIDWQKQSGVAGRLDRQAQSQVMSMDSAPDQKSEKPEKSYLYSAVESISPWGGSRSITPRPIPAAPPGEASGLKNQHGGDIATQHRYGLKSKDYPSDCPPLNARWFYAVDVPKRKPRLINNAPEDTKIPPAPKKFVAFSGHDSRAIEAAYQKLTDDYHNSKSSRGEGGNLSGGTSSIGRGSNIGLNNTSQEDDSGVRVPVHEDFLFDVDIERRELAPVYWLGPIFACARGTWFYDDGKPCDESLASQLEQGYLKVKPFRYPPVPVKPSRPMSTRPEEESGSLAKSGAFGRDRSGSDEVTPGDSTDILKGQIFEDLGDSSNTPSSPNQPQKTYRLFGTYMNSIVTYQDSTVAWLSVDSIMSRVSSTVYSKFAGGGYLGGIKLIRGYSESRKSTTTAATEKTSPTPVSAVVSQSGSPSRLQLDERQQKLLKRRSAPPSTTQAEDSKARETAEATVSIFKGDLDPDSAEAVRKRDASDIQNDYNDRDNENQGREIDHLILVTHGIGQRLGMRTESVNFIHDVNVLRQTLKNVYSGSADLQALNSEIDRLPKNCRVQVLPVCWRHLLDFPKKRQTRKEHDLGDTDAIDDEYPSLEDITIEGVPFVRSLITDLALDILLYQSAYREQIIVSVLNEANRIFSLFKERHPEFKGKVSLMGHSLGSAIFFDLLCRQREIIYQSRPNQKRDKQRSASATQPQAVHLDFDFDVEDFYCLGSPIGLFQMLKGRSMLGRHTREDAMPAESPLDPDYMQDPFLAAGSTSHFSNGDHLSSVTGLPLTISSPKVAQLYNIFHPSDPIAYRLEPLIAPAMSSMKPQLLPYTKRGISSSVNSIGAKVGQSFSGLWSSLSSGIASSLLNRSLGLTNDDVARMEAPAQPRGSTMSAGAGTNISAGGVVPAPSLQRENTIEKKMQLAEETVAADRDGSGANAPTLIDDEMETLFAGFEKTRKARPDGTASDKEWSEAEEKGKKLKREEMKVRALNQNGRVDYSIQESILDYNPINTIASHLSYWADEDVSHFVMSQLLSRHRPSVRAEKLNKK